MTRPFTRASLLIAAGLSLVCDAAVWAGTASVPTLTQVGATAVLYRGNQVDVALSYRYAKLNPAGHWMLLDVAMTSNADTLELPRTSISLRTPSGQLVPLATQEEFSRDYPQLAAMIMRANVAREPLGYLTPQRFRPIRFFAERGRGLVWPSTWLDEWHNNYGRLFFRLPRDIEKGPYELIINLSRSQVEIPFTI